MVDQTVVRVWTIYKITRIATGKSYVGLTGTTLAQRWQSHVDNAKTKHRMAISGAIRKHGRAAFTIENLEECPDKSTACAAEQRWITALGTIVPKGYNITKGGNAGNGGVPWPEERRLEWSKRIRKIGWPSAEARAKTTAKMRGRKAYPGQREVSRAVGRRNKGRKHTAKTILAVLLTKLKSRLGTRRPNGMPWGCSASGPKFRAMITKDEKRFEIGSFKTIEEAEAAYQTALRLRIEEIEAQHLVALAAKQ